MYTVVMNNFELQGLNILSKTTQTGLRKTSPQKDNSIHYKLKVKESFSCEGKAAGKKAASIGSMFCLSTVYVSMFYFKFLVRNSRGKINAEY